VVAGGIGEGGIFGGSPYIHDYTFLRSTIIPSASKFRVIFGISGQLRMMSS
jgi:hypothetical protein